MQDVQLKAYFVINLRLCFPEAPEHRKPSITCDPLASPPLTPPFSSFSSSYSPHTFPSIVSEFIKLLPLMRHITTERVLRAERSDTHSLKLFICSSLGYTQPIHIELYFMTQIDHAFCECNIIENLNIRISIGFLQTLSIINWSFFFLISLLVRNYSYAQIHWKKLTWFYIVQQLIYLASIFI